MPKYLLILTLLLPACTIARYGDSFEKHATHIEKSYNKPFEELYTCLFKTEVVTPNDHTFTTSNSARYERSGFTRVEFKKTGAARTQVTASGIMPIYDPNAYIALLDKCAAK